MKQCPVCKTTYTDDSLTFCLSDGATLAFAASDMPTEQMSFGGNPVRVDIPTSKQTIEIPNPHPTVNQPAPRKSYGWLIGLLVLGLLGFLFAGVLAVYYFSSRGEKITNTSPSPNPTTNPVKTDSTNANYSNQTDNETAKLKEKLEKLEKQLAEQQKAANKSSTVPPVIQQQTIRTATVYSPNDGYLALRTAPSSSAGTQILKIPHGDAVTVGNCLTVKKADGKSGRWCQVVYNGQAGWAFDGFLRY